MSSENRIYLDYNAGAPLLPQVYEVMLDILACTGNASSVHGEGRQMRQIVEKARETVANYLDCAPRQVIFTSGATEAAMLALSPEMRKGSARLRFSHLYVGATEHPCVLSGGRFTSENRSLLPVFHSGLLDLDTLSKMLEAHDHTKGLPLVAVMLANNETGIIQPIREIAGIVHAHGGALVVDAVQGLAKMEVAPSALDADLVLLSAHKIGGPQGAGALVLGNREMVPVPLLTGGGQESFRRAGTENVAAIAGFAAAVQAGGGYGDGKKISAIRDFIETGIDTISSSTAGALELPVIFGSGESRLANTICFAVPEIGAETALISLDLSGIAVSSGSACSSGKVRKSHVLEAMGVPDDLAKCALRISLGAGSEHRDGVRFLDAWQSIVSHAINRERRIAV
jgi:cysteine desulfurase